MKREKTFERFDKISRLDIRSMNVTDEFLYEYDSVNRYFGTPIEHRFVTADRRDQIPVLRDYSQTRSLGFALGSRSDVASVIDGLHEFEFTGEISDFVVHGHFQYSKMVRRNLDYLKGRNFQKWFIWSLIRARLGQTTRFPFVKLPTIVRPYFRTRYVLYWLYCHAKMPICVIVRILDFLRDIFVYGTKYQGEVQKVRKELHEIEKRKRSREAWGSDSTKIDAELSSKRDELDKTEKIYLEVSKNALTLALTAIALAVTIIFASLTGFLKDQEISRLKDQIQSISEKK